MVSLLLIFLSAHINYYAHVLNYVKVRLSAIYLLHTHTYTLAHTHTLIAQAVDVLIISFFMTAGNLVRHCGHLLEIKMLLCVRLSRGDGEVREGAASFPSSALK